MGRRVADVAPRKEQGDLPMRVGLGQFMQPTEERLIFIKQLGVDDILLNMYETPLLPDSESPLTGETEWSAEELTALRERVKAAGLRLNAVENLPIAFYDDVMLDGPEKDTQIEHIKNTLRNLGQAGIPILGYHWSPSGVWRTVTDFAVRGSAESSAFDAARLVDDELTFEREYTQAELWDNYVYFLEEVLPVAEEVGVTLALHPNDPPIERIGGVPFLFRNFESFKRAMSEVPSDNHGLELCLGTWSEMGENLFDAIEYFGERDEIIYVHFRDVDGTVPKFNETFVDKGNFDEYQILQALRDVGFSGMMIPDHVPKLEGDDSWKHRGRAFTVGYLRGMLKSFSA